MLSLIFWSVMLIVSLKYVTFVLRFDNKGEGGVLALLAFAQRLFRANPRLQWTVGVIAVFAASLFYGDAVITPAISVLSAVEGLSVATPALEKWVVPLTVGILVALFAIQSTAPGRSGRCFGPITVVWFLTLAVLGLTSIVETPDIVAALDPSHAVAFAYRSPGLAFLALGAVFLTLTGGEALYADMGHFGPLPIRVGLVRARPAGADAELPRAGRPGAARSRRRSRTRSICSRRPSSCCRWSRSRPRRR